MKRKRNMPPHIVLPSGMWRFVKKKKSQSPSKLTYSSRNTTQRYISQKGRNVKMARYRRSRGRGGFGMKGMLAPIAAGVADAVINPRSPIDGLGSTAVGFIMKDQMVKTIGLYQVGQSIAQFIPFVGTSTTGGIGAPSQV